MSKDFNDESAALEATVGSYFTAFMRGDVPAVLATYAEDGVLIAPIGPAIEGKKQLAEVYPGLFDAVDFNMAYETKEVLQTSADWGFVRTASEGTQTNKANGDTESTKYLELFLLRKSEAGEWQIARYSTTQISPTA